MGKKMKILGAGGLRGARRHLALKSSWRQRGGLKWWSGILTKFIGGIYMLGEK